MLFPKQINKKAIFKFGIGSGLAEIIYIILVAFLFTNLDKFLPLPPAFFGFFLFLLLFVFSAAISGFLTLTYPLYLALQKRYYEALMTFVITLLTIFTGFIIIIVIMLITNS